MADEPTINPYAPPRSDGEVLSSELAPGAFARPLFSPRQVMVATFCGTLLAGVFLLQANYRAMGRSGAASKALVLGGLSTVALMALGLALPKNVPGLPINIAVTLGFYKLVESLQGQTFSTHREAGGARQSNWLVFGIIVAGIVTFLLALFAVMRASGALDGLD